MKYTLKSFSQDIHLNRPDESQHFLVFNREDGTEFRVPVPQETIIAITQNTLAYEARKEPKVRQVTDEELEEAIDEVQQEAQDEAEEGAEAFFDKEDADNDLGDASVFGDGDYLEDVEPDVPRPILTRKRSSAVSEDEVPSL